MPSAVNVEARGGGEGPIARRCEVGSQARRRWRRCAIGAAVSGATASRVAASRATSIGGATSGAAASGEQGQRLALAGRVETTLGRLTHVDVRMVLQGRRGGERGLVAAPGACILFKP